MSDSVRPQRQPTRLLRPWDSPGKNTGVGCHFLLQCMKVKSKSEVTQSLSDPMDCSLPGSSIHGIFQAGFPRQKQWSGLPFPSPWDLPDSGIKPASSALAGALPLSHQGRLISAAAAALLQLCPTLCDPIDSSPLGSSVPGILQARILECG